MNEAASARVGAYDSTHGLVMWEVVRGGSSSFELKATLDGSSFASITSMDYTEMGAMVYGIMNCLVALGTIHKRRSHRGGRWGWSKNRHSKGGCVDLVLDIRPKCGQGGGGYKTRKFCGRPL